MCFFKEQAPWETVRNVSARVDLIWSTHKLCKTPQKAVRIEVARGGYEQCIKAGLSAS